MKDGGGKRGEGRRKKKSDEIRKREVKGSTILN